MDHVDHGRVRALFEGCLALAPEARAAYLERECAGDGPLRAAVERWLELDAGAETGAAGGLLDRAGGLRAGLGHGAR